MTTSPAPPALVLRWQTHSATSESCTVERSQFASTGRVHDLYGRVGAAPIASEKHPVRTDTLLA